MVRNEVFEEVGNSSPPKKFRTMSSKQEEEEEEQQETWSDLPYDLVEMIMAMDNLVIPEISNYVRCGAVCSSWRTVFLNHRDYRVLAIYGPAQRLAFYRPSTTGRRVSDDGDKWIFIEIQSNPNDKFNSSYQFKDVIYYKGKFLALHISGDVVVLDPEQDMKETIQIRCPSRYHRQGFDGPSASYLVESSGDLLLILRYVQYGEPYEAMRKHPYYRLVESSGDLTLIRRYVEDDERHVNTEVAFCGDDSTQETMGGACGYGNLRTNGYGTDTAALSSVLFSNRYACGECFHIKCTQTKDCYSAVVTTRDVFSLFSFLVVGWAFFPFFVFC